MGNLTNAEIMVKKIVFATHNLHKTQEVKSLLTPLYEVLNLVDIGCDTDIPETGLTFAANATLKSTYVVNNFGLDCFADDSGLEVEALNNEPGIFSARYSGQRGDALNMNFLLEKMKGITNRNARFKTVISLIQNKQHYLFEGVIYGKLRTAPTGIHGFGYDPIFEPDGYPITFGEMELSEKNKISHRAIAMRKLIAFLQEEKL
jgi:XTP/dITP diphosphohydrolase